MKVIVLDSGPLGVLTNPNRTPKTQMARQWLDGYARAGNRIVIPEIVDFEIRRELILIGSDRGITALDHLILIHDFLPLTTHDIRFAATLWAVARAGGFATAADSELDIDVLLAAQALSLNDPGIVIATGNVRHLSRFVPAERWDLLTP